ncbi:GNAT family N-acetyltransferase [Hymenobacter sp. HMF4947]|uniref:GNAT family N-acetyltransferase n=1 Tax=Hymenobacter ginkgonis TaxID=2682976 RepID=A0A7K1TBQ5_9BACT|nr:GNAT family N-acetyltransferase [Hymenobacter ginkgonis]MVN75836.1 GNAT family N-acetyltransferase [Hymenobacter ginkgonis]
MSSPLRISIAKANAATATRLANLGRQTFTETFAADNKPSDLAAYLHETYQPELQLAQLQNPQCTYLLTEMQGQLVGYLQLWKDSRLGLSPDDTITKQLEIKQLYIVEDWVGTGLGAALMRRALEIAQASGVSAVVLGVWENNHRAKAFYQRFGFREVGETAFKLGEDVQRDLIYRKGLAGR